MTYEELEPLFGTAAKKVGTRIAVLVALGTLLAKGLPKNESIKNYIASCVADESALLQSQAKKLA